MDRQPSAAVGSGRQSVVHADDYRPSPELDHGRRRRLRLGSGQPGRRVRPKVRHLLALGPGNRQAILTARRSKGYGPRSQTLATQAGLTHAWLPRQGWISVRDLGRKAQG